jgi:predicted enzyme related to lactoylglutathione lyase
VADGFIWYELVTNDMDKAVAFYSKVVGWDIRDSGMPGMRYMLFGKDGKDVGGMMTWTGAGAPGMPPEWMGHIHTAKLDAELEAVTADGGMVVKPATDIPTVGRFAVVLDPQKVKYLLFEPVAGQPVPARLGQNETGNVGWHELLTDDYATAWEYYSKHYGWEKDFAHDMGPMGVYQTFRTDKPMFDGGMMSIKGVQGMPEGVPPHWNYYFVVDDVDAAVALINDAGGKVLMGPHDVPGGSRILQGIDDQGAGFALSRPPRA